jgi:hypothetical protein
MASSATLNRRVHSARGTFFGAASAAIAANTPFVTKIEHRGGSDVSSIALAPESD